MRRTSKLETHSCCLVLSMTTQRLGTEAATTSIPTPLYLPATADNRGGVALALAASAWPGSGRAVQPQPSLLVPSASLNPSHSAPHSRSRKQSMLLRVLLQYICLVPWLLFNRVGIHCVQLIYCLWSKISQGSSYSSTSWMACVACSGLPKKMY